MRRRPCLPEKPHNGEMSAEEVESGLQFPLFSCPYRNCCEQFNNRVTFLHHVAGSKSDSKHLEEVQYECKDDMPHMTRLDYVYGAAAIAERERWPRIGLSVTRRALSTLGVRYNDEKVQCLACFVFWPIAHERRRIRIH